jgi:hypothetical protein
MTRPLSRQVRDNLEAADRSPAWEHVDKEVMRMSAEAMRDAFPMADIRLAQFLIETAFGIENVLAKPDGELRSALIGYQSSLTLLASAVSRKVRGLPPI